MCCFWAVHPDPDLVAALCLYKSEVVCVCVCFFFPSPFIAEYKHGLIIERVSQRQELH